MTLEEYRAALGVAYHEMARKAEQLSRERITPRLLREAERGHPIALVKAQAICTYLSKELHQTVRPEDVSGLKTC